MPDYGKEENSPDLQRERNQQTRGDDRSVPDLYGFDFHDLLISAARYYMGRMTIQTCSFARQLAEAWPNLLEGTRGVIRQDLEWAFAQDDRMRELVEAGKVEPPTLGNYGLGQDIDRAAWEQVRKAYAEDRSEASASEASASEASASEASASEASAFEKETLSDIEQLIDEKLLVAGAMMKRGGSFVQQLGEALLHADPSNVRKIRQTWPDYWQQYLDQAQ